MGGFFGGKTSGSASGPVYIAEPQSGFEHGDLVITNPDAVTPAKIVIFVAVNTGAGDFAGSLQIVGKDASGNPQTENVDSLGIANSNAPDPTGVITSDVFSSVSEINLTASSLGNSQISLFYLPT